MKLLVLDTSSHIATIGVLNQGEILVENIENIKNHAAIILPVIQNLLQKANLSIKDLNAIGFGKGPGSFTGIRISVSIAKAMAFAHNLPLYAVSTLQNIAYSAFKHNNTNDILTLIDARIKEVYWSVHSKQNLSKDEFVSAPQEVITENTSLALAGFGWEQYFDLLPMSVRQNIKERYIIYPEAKTMIEMISAGLLDSVSAEDAMPSYIRNKVTGN